MKTTTSKTNSRLGGRARAGFTLIELIAAIGFVAIVINFLPAVQSLREAGNEQMIEQHLKGVGARLVTQYKSTGKFPASLEEIVRTPGGALLPDSSTDRKAGFQFVPVELKPDHVRLVAEPIPGVTGGKTAFLDAGVNAGGAYFAINFAKSAGADQNRKRMLDEASAAGARAFGRLLALDPSSDSTALKNARPESESQARQQQVFSALRGPDGKVRFSSILDYMTSSPATTSNPSAKAIFQELAQDFHRTFQLGALGEQVATWPGLTSLPIVQSNDRFLNFSRLSSLTSLLCDPPELRTELLGLVAQASAAALNGDLPAVQKAMAAYRAKLDAADLFSFSWGMSGAGGGGGAGVDAHVPFRNSEALGYVAGAMQ